MDYKKFREIFRGLDRAYGVYYKGETKENGKLSGKAYIKKEPLLEEYYKYHLEGQDPSLTYMVLLPFRWMTWSQIRAKCVFMLYFLL